VTTFAVELQNPSTRSFCGLLRWCHTADWLAKHVVPGAEVIVFTNHVDLVQRECPRARLLPFDGTLSHIVERWQKRNREHTAHASTMDAFRRNVAAHKREPHSRCPSSTLLKWEVINPRHYANLTHNVILYLDSDVDARFVTSLEALRRYDFQGKLAEFAADPHCRLRATPDHMAPVNTGIMLLKPSMSMYREGLALLRTRVFDLETGFNGTGRPMVALNGTVTGKRAQPLVKKARGYWKDTWDFVCGDGDQGLFTAMYMARHQQFCVPKYWDKELRVHHWWGDQKPWYHPITCAPYFRFLEPHGDGHPWSGYHLPNLTRINGVQSCHDYLEPMGRGAGRSCQGRTWPLI